MVIDRTFADVFRPSEKASAAIYDAFIVICASLVVGLSAQLKVYLPFSPVPITGQTFAVLMLGALLGSRRGALAMLLYLIEGAIGLPVFAGGAGAAVLLGPTGGYLVGFVPAAYLVGGLAERGWDRRITTTIAAMVLGNIVLHSFGFVWLAELIGIKPAFFAGVCPFVVGDILKVILAAVLLPAGWEILNNLNKALGRR